MNFYDFHIGDYASRTGHLEPMEDLAYRRMLDLYYVREEPLPWDVADIARLIRLRGQEEAIKAILKEFFVPSEGEGWLHRKCEKVIATAQEKRTKAQASAKAMWDKKKSGRNANAEQSHCERIADAEQPGSEGNAPSPSPTTHSQENPPTPRKRGKSFDPRVIELPDWLPRDAWCEWCDDREERGKKVTERAAKKQLGQLAAYRKDGHAPEAVLAHCIGGSFQGLYPPPKSKAQQANTTVPGRPGKDPALQKLEEDALKATKPAPEVQARMDAILKGKVYQ